MSNELGPNEAVRDGEAEAAPRSCGKIWVKPELSQFRAGDARGSTNPSIDGVVQSS